MRKACKLVRPQALRLPGAQPPRPSRYPPAAVRSCCPASTRLRVLLAPTFRDQTFSRRARCLSASPRLAWLTGTRRVVPGSASIPRSLRKAPLRLSIAHDIANLFDGMLKIRRGLRIRDAEDQIPSD